MFVCHEIGRFNDPITLTYLELPEMFIKCILPCQTLRYVCYIFLVLCLFRWTKCYIWFDLLSSRYMMISDQYVVCNQSTYSFAVGLHAFLCCRRGCKVQFEIPWFGVEWCITEWKFWLLFNDGKDSFGKCKFLSFATEKHYQQQSLINQTNTHYDFLFVLQMTVQFVNLSDIRNLKIIGFRFVKNDLT